MRKWKKVSKLSKLYKVNHVGVNINNMYKLLCIKYNDCFASCIPLCQLSLKVRLCSSTETTSRKQVTNCLYFVVLILIPQFSSHLHESCFTSNVSEENLIRRDRVDKEVFQKLGDGETDLTEAQKVYLPNSAVFSRR